MKIEFYKNFTKNYNKRFKENVNFKKRFIERTKLFQTNPANPLLKDHQLKGKKAELRSFSITGDIRIVYKEMNNVVYFVDIGSHNQVY